MQLTEEDWNSKEAKNVVVGAAFIVAVAAAFSVFAVAFAIGIVAVTAGVALALDSELMRFPRDYLHYKRRIKS